MTRALASWCVTVGGAVVAGALIAPSMASGAGRTYEVVQCDPLNRGVAGAALDDAPSYAVKQGCGDPTEDHAIKISNTRFAQQGRSGRVRWSTGSPSLGIVGASVQARLRRDRGHMARLWMADSDGDEPPGWGRERRTQPASAATPGTHPAQGPVSSSPTYAATIGVAANSPTWQRLGCATFTSRSQTTRIRG